MLAGGASDWEHLKGWGNGANARSQVHYGRKFSGLIPAPSLISPSRSSFWACPSVSRYFACPASMCLVRGTSRLNGWSRSLRWIL